VGIVSAGTLARIAYELAFLAALVYFTRRMAGLAVPAAAAHAPARGLERAARAGAFALYGLTLVFALVTFRPESGAGALAAQVSGARSRPNIILFGSDGLNAANMSVYGYERDTTPFLRELAGESLVGLNHFPNADHSLGSDTALLTGKLPLATRVYNDQDILRGADMYLHLPGILKLQGYRTVQLGVPSIIDARAQNFQDAFEAVNCREVSSGRQAAGLSHLLGAAGAGDAYLLRQMEDRITARLRHILFIEEMVDPYKLVTQESLYELSDRQRLDCLYAYLDDSRRNGSAAVRAPPPDGHARLALHPGRAAVLAGQGADRRLDDGLLRRLDPRPGRPAAPAGAVLDRE
jgi:hypothetical protein